MDVPPDVRQAAVRAFADFDPDLVVADLVDDSLEFETPINPASRLLRFRSDVLSVLVDVHPGREGLTAAVQLAPPQPSLVQAEYGESAVSATIPDDGHITLTAIPPGLFRLVFTPMSGREQSQPRVATAWVRV